MLAPMRPKPIMPMCNCYLRSRVRLPSIEDIRVWKASKCCFEPLLQTER